MAGSETGVMTSSGRMDPFGASHQKNQQPVIQNMRLAFSSEGSAVYKPVVTAGGNNNNIHYQPSSVSGSVGGVMEGSGSGALPSHGINMNSAGSGGDAVKKKRGRPRKYAPDGSMASVALALVSPPPPQSVTQSQPQPPPPSQQQHQPPPPSQQQQLQLNGGGGSGGFASSPSPPAAGVGVIAAPPPPPQISPAPAPASVSPSGTTITKKARGRPPGSSNKKHHHVEAMGSTGFGFTPHIITVKAGEDVSSQIMSFSHHGPRAICVLSANGAISNVTLRQSSTSGGTVTYEGRFEILSLSGSFMPSENGGHWSRTGGLSVALSGSDGRVLGGSVAGLLIAATPIQLVVASFISNGEKESKSFHYVESLTAMGRLNPAGGPTGPSSPPSRGTHSGSSGGPSSPIHQNSGAYNSHPQGISSMPWK